MIILPEMGNPALIGLDCDGIQALQRFCSRLALLDAVLPAQGRLSRPRPKPGCVSQSKPRTTPDWVVREVRLGPIRGGIIKNGIIFVLRLPKRLLA